MIFLQRVVFQINQNEEQAVGYAGKGAVLELFMANSRQGTETFAVVFMVVVIHVAMTRVCAIYNKSKLHKL